MRGFWVDPSTCLMWAAKDNGKNVKWKEAVKYRRDMRLAGYADWRPATRSEFPRKKWVRFALSYLSSFEGDLSLSRGNSLLTTF